MIFAVLNSRQCKQLERKSLLQHAAVKVKNPIPPTHWPTHWPTVLWQSTKSRPTINQQLANASTTVFSHNVQDALALALTRCTGIGQHVGGIGFVTLTACCTYLSSSGLWGLLRHAALVWHYVGQVWIPVMPQSFPGWPFLTTAHIEFTIAANCEDHFHLMHVFPDLCIPDTCNYM